jgi:ABC-type sugar transport system permease subunit
MTRRWSGEARRRAWGYLFLLPALLLLLVFKVLPMLRAFQLSFTSYSLLTPPTFVGLRNYRELIADPLFHQSLGVTFYYVLGTCVPIWVGSLALALVFQALPGRTVLRLVYFIPAVVPVVAHAIIWRFMLHPYGMLNAGLVWVGLPTVDWLGDRAAVMPGLILASEWRFVPLFAVLYLTGLQSIPAEYLEAATIDGASWLQRLRFVTLPQLRPTILLVTATSVIVTSKSLTSVLVISGGGPDGASRVLPLFIFQTGFQYFKMGLASTASIVLLLGTMAVTLVQLRLLREDGRG